MSLLTEYINEHANKRPPGEFAEDANVLFFGVQRGPKASAEALRALIDQHQGSFGDVNLFDGEEHSYIELGGWIGDQGCALALIGLGAQLGMWGLLTPYTVLGADLPAELATSMAERGLISLHAPKLV